MNKLFDFIAKFIDKHFKNPKLNAFLKKILSREMFDYLFFGVLTTVVNLVCFHLFEKLLGSKYSLISNIIAWIAAVLFAFVTNKFWVFKSKATDKKTLLAEFLSFTGARLFSLGVEELGLFIAQYWFDAENKVYDILSIEISGMMTAKIILAVIVVILNYIFSKLFIFKKNRA